MKYIIILITVLLPLLINSQTDRAIEAYQEKDYKTALSEWNLLIEKGIKGADVYYNLGNTYVALKDYPRAILNYRKALQWEPHCIWCKQNLKIAEKTAGIEAIEIPEFVLFRIYNQMVLSLQPLTWYCLFIGLLSLGIASVLFKKLNPIHPTFTKLVFALALISLGLSIHREHIKNQTDQFVLLEESPLYLSPDIGSTTKFKLIPGQYLKIKGQLQGWIKVQTTEMDFGWVEWNKGELVQL